MKLDVLIFYEHPARELESCLLLQAILRRLGLTVETRSIPFQFWESQRRLFPRIVVAPWTSRRFFNLKSADGKVPILLDLHQEQIGDAATEGIYQRCTEPFNRIFHAAWGERFREGIISAGLDSGNVFLTGYPRLDLYRPEFGGLSLKREELAKQYDLDPEKQWVLVVSSFAAADLSRDDRARFKEKGFFNIEELAMEAESSRKATFDLLRMQPSERRGLEIIYRPHPAEVSLDVLAQETGVKIIRELDIRHWFLASDLALIWNSTSCIEAYLAGIPFFKFRPQPMNPEFEIPTMNHAPAVTGEELPSLLDELRSSGREEVFSRYQQQYDLFRKDLAPNYEIDRSALEATAGAVLDLLRSRQPQDPSFDEHRYSGMRVGWERFRIGIRDWGIRSGWLPGLIKRYRITINDLPSRAKEERIMDLILRTVDLDAVVRSIRARMEH